MPDVMCFLIGQSPRVALYSAIPVNRTLCALYLHDGAGVCGRRCAAGIVFWFSTFRSRCIVCLMPAITAVVLGSADLYGGSGSIIGTAIAGFIRDICNKVCKWQECQIRCPAPPVRYLSSLWIDNSVTCIASKLKSGWRVGPITHCHKGYLHDTSSL